MLTSQTSIFDILEPRLQPRKFERVNRFVRFLKNYGEKRDLYRAVWPEWFDAGTPQLAGKLGRAWENEGRLPRFLGSK